MGLSNVIRGVGRGFASVGRAVQSASEKLDQAARPQPETMPEVAPTQSAEGAPAARGFKLPDLGPGPDANDPKYQGEGGKKQFETDAADYQHKQDIHQAFTDLDKVYTEAHPGRDFEKEYREQVRMQQAHEAERPQGSGLARAALAIGDFNPAVQQSGRSNLADYEKRVGEEGRRSDESFSQRMTLRARMHESAAADAAAQGNWKKALAEQEKLALLKADEASLEHKRSLEKEGLKQQGATERARIRRDAIERSAMIRAKVVGATHGLSGTFQAQFEKEAAKAVAKFLGPRDLTTDYDPTDLDKMTDFLEHLAELFHNQEHGAEDGGDAYLRTHPNKRKSAEKPKPQF